MMKRPALPALSLPASSLPASSLLALLLLSACDGTSRQPEPGSPGSAPATSPAGMAPATTPSPTASGVPTLPDLTFGQPLPAGGPWRADPVQASDECVIYTAPTMPHAYAIAVSGKLERVTYAEGARFHLPSGIGPGSTEAAVRRAYPELTAEPHKYEAAPAKYLTTPRLVDGKPGLRFEIGETGRVEQIHIGLPSSLLLVEGCA